MNKKIEREKGSLSPSSRSIGHLLTVPRTAAHRIPLVHCVLLLMHCIRSETAFLTAHIVYVAPIEVHYFSLASAYGALPIKFQHVTSPLLRLRSHTLSAVHQTSLSLRADALGSLRDGSTVHPVLYAHPLPHAPTPDGLRTSSRLIPSLALSSAPF